LYRHRGIALPRKKEVGYERIERSLRSIVLTNDPIRRIEGYDIANISGTDSTASMVVFVNGRPDKSQYRKFKIKTVAGQNDVAAQRETVSRRLNHEEWEYPGLILIDGGIGQLNAVRPLLNAKKYKKIRLIALSKPPSKLYSRAPSGPGQDEDVLHIDSRKDPIRIKTLPPDVRHLLQRIRDESHRFARRYHHLLRKKRLFAK
jgi:excinuclease ABC subunit C